MGTEVLPRLTYDESRQLPDGKRYELIRGELHVSPSPNTKHQRTHANLFTSLGPFVNANRRGWLFSAPLDAAFALDTAVQPDLLFISTSRAEIIVDNDIAGPPDLAVEILSASTAAHDRASKLALYAEAGVPWVWFLEPEARGQEIPRRFHPGRQPDSNLKHQPGLATSPQ